jgi:hypothetical protein
MMSGTGLGHHGNQDLSTHATPLVHVKAAATTRTIIQVVQNPTAANRHEVKLTATVSASPSGTPHGNVNFLLLIHEKGKPVQKHNMGSSLLSFGKASFTKLLGSPIKGATYQVEAHYGGAVNHFHPSTSPPVHLAYT